MIHPTDFDSVPADDSADATSAESKARRLWKIACFLLAALSIVSTVAWLRAVDAATVERDQLNTRIAELIYERDASNAALSDARELAKATARDARVSITLIRVGAVIDGVLSEPPDPIAFAGAALTRLQFFVQGRHPLCGKDDFTQPMTVTFLAPDGAVFRHSESPADATSVLQASCAVGQAQDWSISQSFGYQTAGHFALGSWRVVVTDRGTIVAQKSFDLR